MWLDDMKFSAQFAVLSGNFEYRSRSCLKLNFITTEKGEILLQNTIKMHTYGHYQKRNLLSTNTKSCAFAVTHHAYYFIYFSYSHKENAGEMTFLPSSSTFGSSLIICRNTPLLPIWSFTSQRDSNLPGLASSSDLLLPSSSNSNSSLPSLLPPPSSYGYLCHIRSRAG
jgi:hypothetical protein